MPATREGGCLCGALRYEVRGEPLAVSVCHCPDCQGQSGSAFGMSMVVPRDAFRWLSGEPRTWSTVARSGASKDCLFCRRCGTRVLNQLGSMPDTVNVKPGTLDDRSWLDPVVQVWTATKQPWISILPHKASFEGNPQKR